MGANGMLLLLVLLYYTFYLISCVLGREVPSSLRQEMEQELAELNGLKDRGDILPL